MTPTQPPVREAEETPQAQLTELHLDERGLEFRMKHPIVPLIAEHLAEAFKDAGGVNYVAFDVNCEDIGPLVLTMQRRLGETPEMQVRRMRATLATTQAERDALAAELTITKATLKRTNEMLDKTVATLRIRHHEPCPEALAVLCDDCPPAGYPTDKTRCEECPRRTE